MSRPLGALDLAHQRPRTVSAPSGPVASPTAAAAPNSPLHGPLVGELRKAMSEHVAADDSPVGSVGTDLYHSMVHLDRVASAGGDVGHGCWGAVRRQVSALVDLIAAAVQTFRDKPVDSFLLALQLALWFGFFLMVVVAVYLQPLVTLLAISVFVLVPVLGVLATVLSNEYKAHLQAKKEAATAPAGAKAPAPASPIANAASSAAPGPGQLGSAIPAAATADPPLNGPGLPVSGSAVANHMYPHAYLTLPHDHSDLPPGSSPTFIGAATAAAGLGFAGVNRSGYVPLTTNGDDGQVSGAHMGAPQGTMGSWSQSNTINAAGTRGSNRSLVRLRTGASPSLATVNEAPPAPSPYVHASGSPTERLAVLWDGPEESSMALPSPTGGSNVDVGKRSAQELAPDVNVALTSNDVAGLSRPSIDINGLDKASYFSLPDGAGMSMVTLPVPSSSGNFGEHTSRSSVAMTLPRSGPSSGGGAGGSTGITTATSANLDAANLRGEPSITITVSSPSVHDLRRRESASRKARWSVGASALSTLHDPRTTGASASQAVSATSVATVAVAPAVPMAAAVGNVSSDISPGSPPHTQQGGHAHWTNHQRAYPAARMRPIAAESHGQLRGVHTGPLIPTVVTHTASPTVSVASLRPTPLSVAGSGKRHGSMALRTRRRSLVGSQTVRTSVETFRRGSTGSNHLGSGVVHSSVWVDVTDEEATAAPTMRSVAEVDSPAVTALAPPAMAAPSFRSEGYLGGAPNARYAGPSPTLSHGSAVMASVTAADPFLIMLTDPSAADFGSTSSGSGMFPLQRRRRPPSLYQLDLERRQAQLETPESRDARRSRMLQEVAHHQAVL
ncbi:hypothetical protein AMAG_14691 [Allomyces macrogynus ATCC 38327]|uniref:Transmembrane protein n=1 Tax=Allomyces macrogynus (strain ATCC 38327) TaxID=578462 RepID=A0A0L0T7P2_ALLM3|nr:hypothetical protein AMAG_14691 [Allomyces macrogynus ATCC 38327]|eukprot:KNE70569.1 hypothetical protein AMAG_14691 [Allomyces macrogynus ATCC 38327]